MEVKREKTIKEVLDEYNISWSYGDKDKTLKTLNMFKEFIEDDEVNDNHNKIWVVTYQDYNMDEPPYNLGEPVITCFNNKENASKCYHDFYLRHDNVLIDECEVYTEFKILT